LWGRQQGGAFEEVKNALTTERETAPVLALFDPTSETIISADGT